MTGDLEIVQEELSAGTVTPQALVLVFRAAEEAEERRDVHELERSLSLARGIADAADGDLHAEARKLVELCEERLERIRAPQAVPGGEPACPECGHEVQASAVRCRACGTLLV